jgi:hypothetical protein
MGLSLPVYTIMPFQIMSAEKMIMPKFRIWLMSYSRSVEGSAAGEGKSQRMFNG